MNKTKSNFIVYTVIILAVILFAFLTGCRHSSSSNPSTVYYYENSITPQSINVNITNDGKVIPTSSPSGQMSIEAPEENTYDSDVVLKITESPSVGNESSFLTIGSIIYGVTATKNGSPVNILNHPLNISFTNEEKLNGAESYYIGIKDINGGDWQFVNVYSPSLSVRTSTGSKNQFTYSIYKNNVLIALFADIRNILKDTPKVLGVIATLTPSFIQAENSVYAEDLKVNLLLSGENLSGLSADSFKIKISYLTADSRDSALKVDGTAVSHFSGSGANQSGTSEKNCAHYFQFVPLNTKYSAGFAPSITFDINLKDLSLSAFPNNFIMEISNNNASILSFTYSSFLGFGRTEPGTNTDTNTVTDTETSTDTSTSTEAETKAVVSLKSPAVDFPVANSKVELEFSEDIVWNDETKSGITIDNNAVINDYSYSNKILSLTFKDRLAYNTTYVLNITDMAGVENATLVFKTADAGTVSLKSDAADFQVSNNNIELEFSTDIPWSMANKDKISIDNNVEITDFTYSNKILTLSLRKKLKFASLYLIKIDGLDGIENNTLVLRTEDNAEAVLKSASEDVLTNAPIEVEFSKDIYFENADISNISLNNDAEISGCSYANKVLTLRVQDKLNYDTLYTLTFNDVNGVAAGKTFNIKTQKINASPVISLAEDSIMPNMNGRTSLQPKFFVDFGKPIASSALALKNIKLNGADLPEGCTLEFDADMQNAVLKFASNLDEAKDYILAINAYTDEDKGNINAVEFTFKTMPSENLPGSGTIDDPFLVYHQGHLSQLNNMTPINYLTGNYFFKQMDDISFEGNWIPIGNFSNKFNGNYDGNNKTLSNLKISTSNYDNALFAYIDNGYVSNLTLKDFNIFGCGNIGTLCGNIDNSIVENIKVEGNTYLNTNSDYTYIGGLIGRLENSKVKNVQITGNLNILQEQNYRGSYRAGLIGYTSSGGTNEVSNCCVDSPEGLIKGQYTIAGLIGTFMDGKISNCYVHINIEACSNRISGLVGEVLSSSIENCYSDCQISVYNTEYSTSVGGVGGLFGTLNHCNTSNCYASGTISIYDKTSISNLGTLIGGIGDDVTNSINNSFSTVKIVLYGNTYTYNHETYSYNPDAPGTPLWYNDLTSSYVYDSEGTNYFGTGYQTTLGWNPAYWFNLTEGGFPKLIGLPNR